MPPTLDGANAAVPESAALGRQHGAALCSYCSHQMGGSYPPLGSKCECTKVLVKIEWYRDHPCVGRFRNWGAVCGNYLLASVPDTGNPMADLYALALACRRAMEERK